MAFPTLRAWGSVGFDTGPMRCRYVGQCDENHNALVYSFETGRVTPISMAFVR